MKKIMILFAFLVLISCEEKKELEFFKTYDESELLQKQQEFLINSLTHLVLYQAS